MLQIKLIHGSKRGGPNQLSSNYTWNTLHNLVSYVKIYAIACYNELCYTEARLYVQETSNHPSIFRSESRHILVYTNNYTTVWSTYFRWYFFPTMRYKHPGRRPMFPLTNCNHHLRVTDPHMPPAARPPGEGTRRIRMKTRTLEYQASYFSCINFTP